MPIIFIDALTGLTTRALQRAGASKSMALTAAKALVAADTQGLASHGVSRTALYAQHLREGRVNGKAKPKVVKRKGATCLIDARGGLAYEAGAMAVEQAITRARRYGVSFCGVTNSHHFGAAGYHLAPIAEAGLVGLAFTNSPAAINAWGGKSAFYGTNPIAATFPRSGGASTADARGAGNSPDAGGGADTADAPGGARAAGLDSEPPLVIDLSLTEVVRGKIMLYAKEGKPIPLGWALDRNGQPTTDPQAALTGSLNAIGGMKGTMLAMIVELLCCAVTGAAFSFENDSYFEPGRKPRIGHALLAIDPAALAGAGNYFARLEVMIQKLLAEDGVRLPGARRHAAFAHAKSVGVELPQSTFDELQRLANA